jgi:hypothetical protein
MRPPGTFKIAHRTRPASGTPAAVSELDGCLDPLFVCNGRSHRILRSLRSEILEFGAGPSLRIRRVFHTPREIFRLELELPELGYQRMTLLDRDALDELFEAEEVRAVVPTSAFSW